MLAQINAMMQQQMQRASTPDPTLTRLMGIDNGIIDWHTNANNGVKDIYKNPTIGGMLPVYQMMKSNLDKGRIGKGVTGRTDLNNAQYSRDAGLEDDTDRSLAAGGMLETGLQGQYTDARNDLERLQTGQENHYNSSLSGLGDLYNISKDLHKTISNGGWGGFFKGLLGGASQLLSNPALMAAI